MKKLCLVAFLTFFGLATVNAQSFNGGINLGLPIGDAGDGWTFNVTLDLNYLWEVSDQLEAGVATGFSHSFGDERTVLGTTFNVDDVSFLPIAVAGRFNASDQFTIGLDLGYGIGIAPDGNDGGFYYAPRVQYGLSDAIDIVGAYRGVSRDGSSFDVITLGVEFGF